MFLQRLLFATGGWVAHASRVLVALRKEFGRYARNGVGQISLLTSFRRAAENGNRDGCAPRISHDFQPCRKFGSSRESKRHLIWKTSPKILKPCQAIREGHNGSRISNENIHIFRILLIVADGSRPVWGVKFLRSGRELFARWLSLKLPTVAKMLMECGTIF